MTGGSGRRALLVDYGGVLTASLGSWFGRADAAAGLPKGTVVSVVVDAYVQPEGDSFIHRFERGELDADGFRAELDAALLERGHEVDGADILGLVTAGFAPDTSNGLWSAIGRARAHGVATGLLSNSWGTDGYPLEQLGEVFDDLVISGEVGLRKPDPAIYHLACRRLEVDPSGCVFVDDFDVNVQVAEDLGMVGVLHAGDVEATTAAIEDALGLSLRG